MNVIAMIPARLGSQRLEKKNLQLLKGEPLIVHAIRKAKDSNVFDEIWVNSESEEIEKIAITEGVQFHRRPSELANDVATSEDFIHEFLCQHECDYVVQIHSIAPLLKVEEIISFVRLVKSNNHDCVLSAESVQIECLFKSDPVNFSFSEKANSQELTPVNRVSWSITSWSRDVFLKAYKEELCATYFGSLGVFGLTKLASHVIKTKTDLDIAEALFDIVHE